MKRLLVLLLVLAALLAIACTDKPDKPVCGEGLITVTEAQWVPAVSAHYIYADKVVDVVGYWGAWRNGSCPGNHSSATCEQKGSGSNKEHRNWVDTTYTCPSGYSEHAGVCRKLVPEVPGYWTEPVCKVPEPPPYVVCTETTDQGWVYGGDTFDVGSPTWGDWVDNGDGTSTRIGVQATARHQYHYIIDARDDNVICSSEFRDEAGAREVRESTEPVYGCVDPLALNYNEMATVDDQLCEYAPVITPEPQYCKVQGDIWYQCNSGAWLYGTGLLRDCTWCGGLSGRRVVRESYDCGAHYTWYDKGERVDGPPQELGRYPCPSCK